MALIKSRDHDGYCAYVLSPIGWLPIPPGLATMAEARIESAAWKTKRPKLEFRPAELLKGKK